MDAKIAPELQPLAVNLGDLRPDPRNARVHSDRNVTEVMASYREHGQRKPIVVQRQADDGTAMVVRAGNGQMEAARRLGWTQIAAIVVDEKDREAIAYALRDNRTAELAEWDREALGENLRVLSDGDYDMAALGWDGEEVLQLMNDDVINVDDDQPEKEVDVAEHKRILHKVRPPAQMTNDDWQLHLGDCLEGLRKLADNSVDAVVTDPPAGISFMGRGWDSDKGGRDLPHGFGPWLAGLIDGEANFDIHKQKRDSGDYYYCRMSLSLRADDGGMLHMIQKVIGGKVYYGEPNPDAPAAVAGANPKSRLEIVSREECTRLVSVLDRFPLQSKKARDFAIWREALAVSSANAGTNRPDLMEPFWVQLRETRPYAGKVTDATVFKNMADEHQWVAWLQSIMAECLRVLKPGGHLLAWALPRTSHWTMLAIENAGFELRDVVYHAFGSGFPKSLDVSKAIDETLGAERAIIGKQNAPGKQMQEMSKGGAEGNAWTGNVLGGPVTEQAQQWDGWGTALKPAVEPWIMARKPLTTTIAKNVLKHGTGGINIAATRIGDDVRINTPTGDHTDSTTPIISGAGTTTEVIGRWPAHLVMSHGPGCVPIGTFTDEHAKRVGPKLGKDSRGLDFGMGTQQTEQQQTEHTSYRCVLDCPIRIMNEQSAPDDPTDGAARFFYCAKPARSETEAGLDDFEQHTGGEITNRTDGSDGLNSPRAGAGRNGGRKNIHPTKKSIALMRWLVRLVTPPGGTVLDAFAGSGTTGLAALVEGCRFIGFELSPEYHAIASARLRSIIEDPRGADDADSELPEQPTEEPGRIELSFETAKERSCVFAKCPHPNRCEDRCVARTSSLKGPK